MATNILPGPISELLDLAQQNLNGIAAVGATIGLLQYTVANFTPKRTALATKQDAFNDARSALGDAYTPYHAKLADMRRASITGRKMLTVSLGDDWSPAWASPGWPGPRNAVPTDESGLLSLCDSLFTYLTDHPEFEVNTAKIVFTAANFSILLSQIAPLIADLQTKRSALTTARNNRKTEENALRLAMRGIIDVLPSLIAPDSPMWDQFGLNRPAATTTPGQPQGLTLQKTAPGSVLAQCDAVPLATYYRWNYKVEGIDPEFRFWGRTNDPMVNLTGQPLSGTLKVKVEAANEAGPGTASTIAAIDLAA